jgi:hypothetical protein
VKAFFVLLLCGIALSKSFAQNGYGSTSIYDRTAQLPKNEHFFVIPPNGVWNKQPWKDSVYQFDSFQEGKLETATGFTLSHRPLLNYNILIGTMELMNADGSITTLRGSNELKSIWVGDHKYIYESSFGYMEIILEGKASVGRKLFMNGLYELSNGFRYPLISVDVKTSPAKTTRYYWTEKQYFIIGANQKTFRASKNVLPGLFPGIKNRIKAYSKEKNINYGKEEDLLKIVAYANDQALN